MSKFEEAVEKAMESAKKMGKRPDRELLQHVAKGLGPSIYNNDSKFVAMSDKAEIERLHKNFVKKKLGVEDEEKGKAAIERVKKMMSPLNKKSRILVCYFLVKDLKKEDVYG